MISIILIEPEHPGNIGAIARDIANFGLESLYLVDPKGDHLSDEAKARSKHGKHILENATVITQDELSQFDLLIGTTAKLGSDFNIIRTPLTPEQLAERIAIAQGSIGLIFGRESYGLTNEELRMCDLVVTIPIPSEYPTLNISHACSVLLYIITRSDVPLQHYRIPSREENDITIRKIESLLEKLAFPTTNKRETQKKFWKRFIAKGSLTKRELYILLGFIKRVNEKIKEKESI